MIREFGNLHSVTWKRRSLKEEFRVRRVRKLSGKCHFVVQFCTSNWNETYIFYCFCTCLIVVEAVILVSVVVSQEVATCAAAFVLGSRDPAEPSDHVELATFSQPKHQVRVSNYFTDFKIIYGWKEHFPGVLLNSMEDVTLPFKMNYYSFKNVLVISCSY